MRDMPIEDGQIMSLRDSRINMKRVRGRLAILGMLKVRVVVKKALVCEFGGFSNALRDAGIRAIPI